MPEHAITQYQAAPGWCDFKRIAAHHELVCRPAVACALGTEHCQTLTLNAEGDWEVDSKPDWCQLSQTSGSKKTEITLTIQAYSDNGGEREGDIVFKLKGKDYTHKCHVTQYGYAYGEDEFITLQKATRGNNGGIDIVILGDGYDAKDIASGLYLNDMKEQGENAFSGSRISSISFPDGITSIGRGALSSTMLREVTLPENLVNIPEALLQNSTLLSCVRIGSQAAYVGSYSFAGCSPADIYIKASLPPIVAENAFGQSPAPLFEDCTLHVPKGAGAAYKKHSEWGKFVNITED